MSHNAITGPEDGFITKEDMHRAVGFKTATKDQMTRYISWVWEPVEQFNQGNVFIELCKHGNVNIVEEFFKCSFNIQDQNGRSAFWFACAEGHIDIVRKMLPLIEVDKNLPDYAGNTPLLAAIINCREQVANELLTHDNILLTKRVSGNQDLQIREALTISERRTMQGCQCLPVHANMEFCLLPNN